MRQETLTGYITNFIAHIPDETLQAAIKDSFIESAESVRAIDRCFHLLPTSRWPRNILAQFFSSWKASHLKMLAIYGLTCRLQRRALSMEGAHRQQLLMAAALNAETSYEDLGLDYDGQTHAELYDDFAAAFVGDEGWQADKFLLPEARRFKRWVYRNMVVEDLSVGLLTNIFSEIYNHGEYSLALSAFSAYSDRHCAFSPAEKERALLYVNAHVEGETEVAHFLVVVKALGQYQQVFGISTNYEQAKNLFKEYLRQLGTILGLLANSMREQEHGATAGTIASIGSAGTFL